MKDDLIRRSDALSQSFSVTLSNGLEPYDLDVVAVGYINAIPAVDAVPIVHGEWIEYGEPNSLGEYESWYWTCSACGTVGLDTFKYCPSCGVRMDGEKEHNGE